MAKEQLEIINEKIVEDAKDLMSERFPIMVQYFLEDTQMYLEQVEEGVKEKNAEIAISPAHTIRRVDQRNFPASLSQNGA